jgi:hypothetical protein
MIGITLLLGLAGILAFLAYFGSLIGFIYFWKNNEKEHAIELGIVWGLLSIVFIGAILMALHI